MNVYDVLVAAALAGLLFLAVRIRLRSRGEGGVCPCCRDGCGSCPVCPAAGGEKQKDGRQ